MRRRVECYCCLLYVRTDPATAIWKGSSNILIHGWVITIQSLVSMQGGTFPGKRIPLYSQTIKQQQ